MSLLKTALSINNSKLCRYDSQAGFISNFSGEVGNVSGWDIFSDIYLYGAWEGILIGHSKDQSCYIGRTSVFDYIPCEFYHKIRIMMKTTSNNNNKGTLSTGRLQWLTIQDNVWNASKQIDFDLINDDAWHLYEVDLGPSKYWIGDVNNLRLYPYIDGWKGDSFAIESIEIVSSQWKCINGSCSYYSQYEHPCPAAGNGGSCEAGVAKELFSFVEDVNDKFIININDYGDEVFNLGSYTNYKVYDIAKALSAHISSLSIGSYTYSSVEINEYSGALKIVSGSSGTDSTVYIPDSPAARELGFRDEDGNDTSTYSYGEEPATGFDTKSARQLTGFEINKIIADGGDPYAYVHSPIARSVEGGRYDYYSNDGTMKASSYKESPGATFNHDMGNVGKTLIDTSHPFTANGKIKKIYVACELPNDPITVRQQTNSTRGTLFDSKIFILRPHKDGHLKVVASTNLFGDQVETANGSYNRYNPKATSGGQVYALDCDIMVNKGDYLGIYNADIYIERSPRRNRPDATFYHVEGEPTGKFDPGELYMGGSKGFSFYAKSDRMQDSVILDFDLGKRYNIEDFIVYGEKDGVSEFNIATCLDVNWECELYGSSHWHKRYRYRGPWEHTNVAYGLEALNDGKRSAEGGSAGDYLYVGSEGYVTTGEHSYFYINGDNEWNDPMRGAVYDYWRDPVSLYCNFPQNLDCNVHKIAIYFKEKAAYEYLELDYYLGTGMDNGNATRETGYQIIDNIEAVNVDGQPSEDQYRDSSYRITHEAEYYENPIHFSADNNFRLIEYDFGSLKCKGIRLYTHAHHSTKINEIEIYSKFNLDTSLTDVLYFQTSDHGDVWWLSPFSKDGIDDTKVNAYMPNAPRYLTIEMRSKSAFTIRKMDTTLGDEVKLIDCGSDMLLKHAKSDTVNKSTPMLLENVYDRKLTLTADIPRDLVNTDSLIFWNRLGSDYELGNSETGPSCNVHKRPDYDIKDYTGYFLRNCPAYALKNLADDCPAYYAMDGINEWAYFGTVNSGIPIDFGRTVNCAKNHINLAPVTHKYWKLQVYRNETDVPYDSHTAYPHFSHIADTIRFYYGDGILNNIEDVYIQVSDIYNDDNKYISKWHESGVIEDVLVIEDSFPGSINDYTDIGTNWYTIFDDVNFIEFDNIFHSFEAIFTQAKNTGVCFFDINDTPIMSIIITEDKIYLNRIEESDDADLVDDYAEVRVEGGIMMVRSGRKDLTYHGGIVDPPIYRGMFHPLERRWNSGYKSEKTSGLSWNKRIKKMKVIGATIKLSVLPSLTNYEMISFKFDSPVTVDTIEVYTRDLANCGVAVHVSDNGEIYSPLATSDYESENFSWMSYRTDFGLEDGTSGKSLRVDYVLADSAFVKPILRYANTGRYMDPAFAFMRPNDQTTLDNGGTLNDYYYWQSGESLANANLYPHWIVYDFGEGRTERVGKINVVFGQKIREEWWGSQGYYMVPGGCPSDLYIQGSNVYEFGMEEFTGDDFTGENGDPPNETYWNSTADVNFASINDNKLRITANAVDNSVIVSSDGLWYMTGDFDIQINFEILTDSTGNNRGPYFRIKDVGSSNNYLQGGIDITDKVVWSGNAGSGWFIVDTVTYDYTLPGRLRYTRTGDTVSCYHSVGNGSWVLDCTDSTTVSGNSVNVQMFNWTSTPVMDTSITEFDDFKIVTGDVSISDDIWTTLYTTTNITESTVSWTGAVDAQGEEIPTFNEEVNTYYFENTEHYRYYRLYMANPKVDSEDWVSIYAIELLDSLPGPGSREDILYQKPCKASSYVEGQLPSLLTDGGSASYWGSADNVHQWIEVDTERDVTAHTKKMELSFGPDQYHYFIFGVHDNVDWTNIHWINDAVSGWNAWSTLVISDEGKTLAHVGSYHYGLYGNRADIGIRVGDAGKWYLEFNCTGTGNWLMGICTLLYSSSVSDVLRDSTEVWAWYNQDKHLYNGGDQGLYDLDTTSSNLGMAIDLEAGKIWFRGVDGWEGDPITGTDPAFDNLLSILGPDDILFPFAQHYWQAATCTLVTSENNFEYTTPEGYNLGSEDGYVFLTGEDYGVHTDTTFDDVDSMWGKRFRVDIVESSKSTVDFYSFKMYEYAMWTTDYEYTDYFAVDLGRQYKLGWIYNYGHHESYDGCYFQGRRQYSCIPIYEKPVYVRIDSDNVELSSSDTPYIDDVAWDTPILFVDSFDDGTYLDNWLFSDLPNTINSSIWEHTGILDVLSYGTMVSGVLGGPSVSYRPDAAMNNFIVELTFNMRGGGNTAGKYTIEFLNQDSTVIKLEYINPPNTDELGVIRECLYDNDYSHLPDGTRKKERFGENTDVDDHRGFFLVNRMQSYYQNVNKVYSDIIALGTGTGESRSLLKFDLSPLEGVTIISASLNLYGASVGNYGSELETLNASVYRVLKRWVYGDVSWNEWNRTESESWGGVGCSSASDSGIDDDAVYDRPETPEDTLELFVGEFEDEWHSWDITELVQQWLNLEVKNYGLCIIGTPPTGQGSFTVDFVSPGGTDGFRPYIELYYYINDVELKYTGEYQTFNDATNSIKLDRLISEGTLEYTANNDQRYFNNISLEAVNGVRLSYYRYDWDTEEVPAQHTTDWFFLNSVTQADNVRWVKIGMVQREVIRYFRSGPYNELLTEIRDPNSYNMRKLFIYPDPSTILSPGGEFNMAWHNLGPEAVKLTAGFGGTPANIAFLADVTSNYELNTHYPSNLTNGDIYNTYSNGWALNTTTSGDLPYIVIDFKRTEVFNKVYTYGGRREYDYSYDNLPSGYASIPTFELSLTVSGSDFFALPSFIRVQDKEGTGNLSENERFSCVVFKFDTTVEARRLKITFKDWESPSSTIYNVNNDEYEVFSGSYLREVEVRYFVETPAPIPSELWPIVAFDLQYKFYMMQLTGNWFGYMAYSDSSSDDPKRVSFTEKGFNDSYKSGDSSGVLLSFTNSFDYDVPDYNPTGDAVLDGDKTYSEYLFDSGVYFNSGRYLIEYEAYNIEHSEEMGLILDGPSFIEVYTSNSGTLSGTGMWLSIAEVQHIDQSGYYNIVGRANSEYSTASMEWGIRKPVVSYASESKKKWILTGDVAAAYRKTPMIFNNNITSNIAGVSGQELVLTEYSSWWLSTTSELSDEYLITKEGVRSLRISYPDSNLLDIVSYDGEYLGSDTTWNIKDLLCFWLYISDITKLDTDSLNVYVGYEDKYYTWLISDHVTLTTGWNRIRLKYEDFKQVMPKESKYTGRLERDLDFSTNYGTEFVSMKLFRIVYRGKGEEFFMCVDWFKTERNKFDDDVKFGPGLCLCVEESCELPLSNVRLSKGSLEFWMKPYTDFSGGDIFGTTYSRNLVMMNSDSNDILAIGLSAGRGLQVSVGDLKKGVTTHGVDIDPGDVSYFDRGSITHLGLVWDSTGTFMGGTTIKLFINNVQVFAVDEPWEVENTKISAVRLGGVVSDSVYEFPSYGSAIFQNIKFYDYCRKDFDLTAAADDTAFVKEYIGSDFIEISKDDVIFHDSDSAGLPLVFEEVLPGESRTVYVRTIKDENFSKSSGLTGELHVEWEVGV